MLSQLTCLPLLAALGQCTVPEQRLVARNNDGTPCDGFVNNGTIGSVPCAVVDTSNSAAIVTDTTIPSCPDALPNVYPYNKINLRAPDDSVRATFIPYGATMTEFWVKDRSGTWRDNVLGYDNATNWGTDPIHPFIGQQVGRYANRIKNGTFELDGETYHTPLNENGIDTLHGGDVGYDKRSHTIEYLNSSSVVFTLTDPSGDQGFPGTVMARASYTLLEDGQLHINMDANVTEGKTPVMLSHHGYWALHGYGQTNNTILDHTLYMPKADKYIATDGILIPTGPIPSVDNTPYDFTTARTFSERYDQTLNVCGTGCQGWDSCFVMSQGHQRDQTVLQLTSPETGIRMSIKSDQDAIQIYTCDGISSPTKGSIPRKRVHGGDGTLNEIYENHSCVVVEMEDYIDGINNPEWGRNQIYSPDRPYQWRAEYQFSIVQ
jgi:aldose 1-epimerase